ncbi:MAG: hypothetical protein IB618_01065 [Candidatus Pacearchaeota archaeon]|nr:MAG: hypothetical protein IB618_01065 [Candidatus Pacearchaeota archaeon]
MRGKDELYEKLCFLFRHRNKKEFEDLEREIVYSFGIKDPFGGVRHESLFLTSILMGEPLYEGNEDFREFYLRGLRSWSEFLKYLKYLHENFNMQFPVIPSDADFKRTILVDCKDSIGLIKILKKEYKEYDIQVPEIKKIEEKGELTVLDEINYRYSFKNNPQIIEHVIRILNGNKQFYVPLIRDRLEEIKQTTRRIENNVSFDLFKYGKFLSSIASKLGIEVDGHFSRKIDYAPQKITYSKKEGSSHVIEIKEEKQRSLFAEIIIKRQDPLSQFIEVKKNGEILSKIAYGIYFFGKNGFDIEYPQFTSLEGRLEEKFDQVKPSLIKVIKELLEGRQNPLPFHLGDNQIVSWLERFIRQDYIEELRKTQNFASSVLSDDINTSIIKIIEEINYKKWPTKTHSYLGTPKKYGVFLQKIYDNTSLTFVSLLSKNIINYEKENTGTKLRKRIEEIEEKKRDVTRLLREHETALKEALKSLESEKKEKVFMLNSLYSMKEYEKRLEKLENGERIEIEPLNTKLWADVPFYHVEKYSKKLHDICEKVDSNIRSYRFYPGKKVFGNNNHTQCF